MSFSVLICTCNRPQLLCEALRALIVDTLEKPDQVVVVNGGDARADRVVESFMDYPGIEVELVRTDNKNLAASRNLGLTRCTGGLVAMTDDDAQVFPDWVVRMKRAHRERPKAGAVGGPVMGMDAGSLLDAVAGLITFPSWSEPRCVRTLPGVNICYKRQVVEQVGPQDESLFRGEDVDYNWRVKELGWQIYFDTTVRVRHRHRTTLHGLLHQHYMYGRAYVLVRRKHPAMYSIYPRRFRRLKDFLKAANAVAGTLYIPFLQLRALDCWDAKLAALPLLTAAGVAWRWGMFVQRLKLSLPGGRESTASSASSSA